MAVHEKFSGAIAMLRRAIDEPHGLAVQDPVKAATDCAQEIRAYGEKPERVADEIDAVERAADKFARIYSRHHHFAVSDEDSRKAINDERARAHEKIDDLEKALDGVELNGRGRAVI